MGAHQLDLFRTVAHDLTHGLKVRLLGCCRHCGERLTKIGSSAGPHAAALHCVSCGCFRQWLPKQVHDLIAETIKQFGGITESIEFHISSTSPVAGADEAEAIGAPLQEIPMDMREFIGTLFLKVKNLKGPCQKTIIDVQQGKYDKANLIFDDGTCLSLNATNTRALIDAFGPNSDDWIQKVIELSVGTISFGNEDKEAILATPISPSVPKDRRKKPKSSMDEETPF